MIANRSAPGAAVVPMLIYDDVGAAADWLCEVFGFVERLRTVGPDGRAGHVQLALGDGAVMLGGRRVGQGPDWGDDAQFRPPRPDEVSQVMTVRVEDIDGHHQRAQARGARILHPPTDYPFGERQYTAVDPGGHRWSLSQSIADIDPAAWGAVVPAPR